MLVKELYKKQEELDRYILDKKSLHGSDRLEITGKKVTALMVEAAELANELRSFKYWSDKGPNVREAKEEYVDCLHFVLSIGNDLFNDTDEIIEYYTEKYNENIKRQDNGY